MTNLNELSREDRDAIDRLKDCSDVMVEQTVRWSEMNTGSTNTEGLKAFAPELADALSALDAEVSLDT